MRLALCTLLALLLAACGTPEENPLRDGSLDCGDAFILYVGQTRLGCGRICPQESREAYRDGVYLVCHECAQDAECGADARCQSSCGPGCPTDNGGCCPVSFCQAL